MNPSTKSTYTVSLVKGIFLLMQQVHETTKDSYFVTCTIFLMEIYLMKFTVGLKVVVWPHECYPYE